MYLPGSGTAGRAKRAPPSYLRSSAARNGKNAMAFVPFTNVVEAELRFLITGQQVENTLYFHKGTAWDATSMSDLGQDLANWWATNIAPELVTALVMTEVKVRDLTTEEAPGVVYTPPSTIAGEVDSLPAPNNVAWVVKFTTGFTGRSSRGRNYVVGFSGGQVNNSVITLTQADALRAGYAALLAVASAGGYEWVIASRYHNGVPRVAGVVTYVSAVSYTDLTTDSQRRRLPGRGT